MFEWFRLFGSGYKRVVNGMNRFRQQLSWQSGGLQSSVVILRSLVQFQLVGVFYFFSSLFFYNFTLVIKILFIFCIYQNHMIRFILNLASSVKTNHFFYSLDRSRIKKKIFRIYLSLKYKTISILNDFYYYKNKVLYIHIISAL